MAIAPLVGSLTISEARRTSIWKVWSYWRGSRDGLQLAASTCAGWMNTTKGSGAQLIRRTDEEDPLQSNYNTKSRIIVYSDVCVAMRASVMPKRPGESSAHPRVCSRQSQLSNDHDLVLSVGLRQHQAGHPCEEGGQKISAAHLISLQGSSTKPAIHARANHPHSLRSQRPRPSSPASSRYNASHSRFSP